MYTLLIICGTFEDIVHTHKLRRRTTTRGLWKKKTEEKNKL